MYPPFLSLVDTTGDARVKERVIKNSRRRCNSNGKIDWTRQRKITAMLEQKAKDLEEERIKLVPLRGLLMECDLP